MGKQFSKCSCFPDRLPCLPKRGPNINTSAGPRINKAPTPPPHSTGPTVPTPPPHSTGPTVPTPPPHSIGPTVPTPPPHPTGPTGLGNGDHVIHGISGESGRNIEELAERPFVKVSTENYKDKYTTEDYRHQQFGLTPKAMLQLGFKLSFIHEPIHEWVDSETGKLKQTKVGHPVIYDPADIEKHRFNIGDHPDLERPAEYAVWLDRLVGACIKENLAISDGRSKTSITGYDFIRYAKLYLNEIGGLDYSLCEGVLLCPELTDLIDEIGQAEVFYSHTQVESFFTGTFSTPAITAMQKYQEKKRRKFRFWVDLFCIRQGARVPDFSPSTVFALIKQCGKFAYSPAVTYLTPADYQDEVEEYEKDPEMNEPVDPRCREENAYWRRTYCMLELLGALRLRKATLGQPEEKRVEITYIHTGNTVDLPSVISEKKDDQERCWTGPVDAWKCKAYNDSDQNILQQFILANCTRDEFNQDVTEQMLADYNKTFRKPPSRGKNRA